MSRPFDRRADRRSSLALGHVEARVLVDRADLDAFIESLKRREGDAERDIPIDATVGHNVEAHLR